MSFTIGSLFDGSGGFPLAASLCGGVPVWAAEIEPYPIAVTKSRFPGMKHLGSVTDIKGGEIDPVDVITFGSPCQDLSIAGKRAGLKHEGNGDEETTRSGLFMEAVRIIKEMREATNGEYPKFALWENVPGAFSSNKGEDFRIVIEELIKICDPEIPPVPASGKTGWPYADFYVGDGWSLAYRVFDAQHWGVPQRRRRIYLVLDLTGGRAREVLFERESLRGYFAEGSASWQGTAAGSERSVGADDWNASGIIPYTLKIRSGCEGGGKGALIQTDKSATLSTLNDQYLFQPVIDSCILDDQGGSQINVRTDGKSPTLRAEMHGNIPSVLCMAHGQANAEICEDKSPTLNCNHEQPIVFDARGNGDGRVCPTITGDHENRVTDYTAVACEQCYVFDKEVYNSGVNATGGHYIAEGGPAPTLRASVPPGVCVHYIVRRLTPTECARLQGFPDNWGHPERKDAFTDEEYAFWLNVRNTHAEVNGKAVKDYTREQMLAWYNKLHTDSSEYKMWGNGIALPCAAYVMQGIAGCFV